jgi:nicotinamidase-related amidase
MSANSEFAPHLAGADSTVLVVIDMQQKLLPLINDGESMVKNAVRLLKMADIFGVPVLLTEQCPQVYGETGPDIKEAYSSLVAEKHFISKDSFSCALDPGFMEKLVELDVRMTERQTRLSANDVVRPRPIDIVLAGIESHICVLQTAMGLLQLGYFVRVCHDCVGSRDKHNKKWALHSMLAMGATVTSSESMAFEWARDVNHPKYRALHKLMKGS